MVQLLATCQKMGIEILPLSLQFPENISVNFLECLNFGRKFLIFLISFLDIVKNLHFNIRKVAILFRELLSCDIVM